MGSISTGQHDADAHDQELARNSHHQHEATTAQFTIFQTLTAVGIAEGQADGIVSKLEAGTVAGAHTWISESSAPHACEPRFEDGWFAGVRDVASHLLRIANTTATAQRGRAVSSALLAAHLQQPASPAPQDAPVEDPAQLRRSMRRTSWRPRNASRGPWPHRASGTGRAGSF
ncbi:hypothetical protein DMH18_37610 [Streptomyces sp. WAC 06783]|uniref:hypothetical protein n=1 Tax=Streptomyces sp. WAC 06783 TaxID=2203211 RepID=UPI000F736B15|nr:hypothetical protein [Streptomyces sp. WAC 06783]RSO03335.1 hypothetical protein DMH18_37610 [Streptomyces sp. WAC 06783]